MNGTAQRERHLAVARVEKRIEDLETIVVDGLAGEVVRDRERVDAQLRALDERLAHASRVATGQRQALLTITDRILAFERQTFWQRVRWTLRGRA